MAQDKDIVEAKTVRIGFLCLTMGFLGLLFFCSKMNACQSCGKDAPAVCKDEFVEFVGPQDRYNNNNHSCTPGARVEIVNSPPAAKAGVMCHCPDGTQAAPVTK